ncbi:MAG: subclass B1 metallo-beta-lactamase [Candidatus Kapaibacterium sp.]
MNYSRIYLIIFFLLASFLTPKIILANEINLKSDNLLIIKLSEHTYQHISYLQTESWGKVPCNGMIIVENDKALILDTPADNESSRLLIEHLVNKGLKIIGIVPTHFHEDCVGGLSEFKKAEIPIYISNRTQAILEKEVGFVGYEFLTFNNSLTLNIDESSVLLEYFGAGHTVDNIIAYYEKDESMFGGCLVKEVGASKGNLADADINEWAKTVTKVKDKYPNAKVIIPGHGKAGGLELLDYTIKLFEEETK